MSGTHAKTLWEAILIHHKCTTRDNNWHHYGAQMVETYLNDKMAKQEKEINELKAALEFYAKPVIVSIHSGEQQFLEYESYEYARKAIDAIRKAKGDL
jgi:hypothetical protein